MHTCSTEQTAQVFLSFQGVAYTTQHSNILATRIGSTHDASVTCHTNLTVCCRSIDINQDMGLGEWKSPNKMVIPRRRNSTSGLFMTRHEQVVRLHRRQDIDIQLGEYCCNIPNSDMNIVEICTNLIGKLINVPMHVCSISNL